MEFNFYTIFFVHAAQEVSAICLGEKAVWQKIPLLLFLLSCYCLRNLYVCVHMDQSLTSRDYCT